MLRFFHFSLNSCTPPKPWQAGLCWFHLLFSLPLKNSQSYLWNASRWMSACYLMCQYWLRQICWMPGRKNLKILQLIFIAFKISKISNHSRNWNKECTNSSLWQSVSCINKLCNILYVCNVFAWEIKYIILIMKSLLDYIKYTFLYNKFKLSIHSYPNNGMHLLLKSVQKLHS